MSKDKKNQVSRRQFLNYTLTGVGGFMAAGMLAPMVRFAIDPVLQPDEGGEFVSAKISEEDITTEPKRVAFNVEQVDAWYESTVEKVAWVYKQEDGSIIALDPTCTHLGCFVGWNDNENYPEHFYCPCHDGLYTKDGVNVPNTPPTAPLAVYEHKIENGILYLGKAIPREEA
ncbi:ubiquinol-cytochrome c reductase iron-sulfur subunit [Salinibacillus xinjiangensis]|uniref:Menaquinol:cytochrome c reductase iron-sulfur subunit n=1 Tax=Salinibacillus xinjiangensis TaxID=1229268 RepID=A0A6G1X5W2_9BACI|nr:ubiquinol-cytochrome c reductase iron-sulfur subunit [Salinibacillus xinjiangensis]MRG86391.1 Rieske 2Fe-2S domain-containing protein [Salinibacillus xinjiangensis]